jgi:photosystem II stability/assembly factor-like uncharacterized protein
MLGWGIQLWGLDYWGGIGPLSDEGFGDFHFEVLAMSQGYTIRVKLTTPEPLDSQKWSRRFVILRKRDEWPQSVSDTGVEVILDAVEPVSVGYEHFDTDLIAGENYYYRLFLLGVDGLWYSSRAEMDSAYPYSRWGNRDYMYMSLPRGWRSHDRSQDLFNFLDIVGALADDVKTDCEYLRTLFSIDKVHEDLISIADSKIGWPTWLHVGGIHKRKDSASAVDTYKRLGTDYGYAQLIETVTDWELTITEGWKYIMWSNNIYCTTPDLADPGIKGDLGGPNDKLKYTNDPSKWQSLTGLGFYLTEIPGITGPFTQSMWDRILFLIEWGKASYVVYQVCIVPVTEEQYPYDGIIDDDECLIAHIERSVGAESDEEDAPFSPDLEIFMSNNSDSITNTDQDRSWHNYLEFDFPAEGTGIVLAIDYAGDIWRSTNYGVSWAIVHYTSLTGKALFYVGSGVCLAGFTSGTILRSTDAGLTWTTAQTGMDYEVTAFGRLSGTDDILAGTSNTSGSNFKVWRSQNGGLTWAHLYTAASSNESIVVKIVPCDVPGMGFIGVAGGYTSSYPDIWRTEDYGVTWSRVHQSGYSGRRTTGGAYLGEGHVVFGITGNSIIRTSHDYGDTWTGIVTGATSTSTSGICAIKPLEGLAVMDNGSVYKTYDGGVTWVYTAQTPGLSKSPVYAFDRFVVMGGQGYIRRSVDEGDTWMQLSGGPLSSEGIMAIPKG